MNKLKLCIGSILILCLYSCMLVSKHDEKIDNIKRPTNLLVEGLERPNNVQSQTPRLSWHANVTQQVGYQVQVAGSIEQLKNGMPDFWDSGKVLDKRSVNISYRGKELAVNDTLYWRVRVWSKDQNKALTWSEPSSWQMGLLQKKDWQAKWIQVEDQAIVSEGEGIEDWMLFAADIHQNSNAKLTQTKRATQLRVLEQLKQQPTASMFRYSFNVPKHKKLRSARLHSTAAGYYEVFLNGDKVDERLMDPGQTDYDKRILYNTDNVYSMVDSGQNTIAVHLGSGWYAEDIAFSRWANPDASPKNTKARSLAYGQPAFIAQLELEFTDGSTQVITSNEHWLTHASPVLKEGLFSGELFDARRTLKNWNTNAESDTLSMWKNAKVLQSWPTERLEPQLIDPIKAIKKLEPINIFHPDENVWVLDFGQNFTGIPTIDFSKLLLEENQSIHLRYAEWVDKAGNISQKSGGGAPLLKQVDTYIATGNESNSVNTTWTPTFTWHGFRYVEIRGLKQEPPVSAFSAHLLRSSVKVAGQFKSSDELLNRIHKTALWGYESNLMAVPMDCPIRERAGWTGDAHAALITGNYNYNMDNFWGKYLGDFKTATFVAPAVVPGKRTHGDKYDWAAAEIMIAWEHYRHHGDVQLLRKQYESMQEYMDAAQKKLDNSLLRIGYGDWCDPVKVPGTPRVNGRCSPQHTSPTVTSSALFAHTANLMAKISNVLQKPQQAKLYTALFEQIKNQFNKELFDPSTQSYSSQTANAMAIMFEIAPPGKRSAIAKAINDDVLNNWNGHASVGALGQTYLYRALSDYGFADTAFNIFKAEGYPGYQYLFEELNATTLWERKGFYDPKQDPDGTKAPGFSLNHPFHSGYDGWFYEGLGGVRPLSDSVGFQDFELVPVFVKGLESVDVSYTTPYGKIKSQWQREGGKVTWDFTVPNNTSALVQLPNRPVKIYQAGDYRIVYEE